MYHIMIVDDDPDNLEVFSYVLREAGYEVATAQSVQRAIDLAHNYPPDLFLMDLHMPQVDGFTGIEYIRHDPMIRNIPVVAITSDPDFTTRQRAKAAGCNHYLTRPVRAKELYETLQRLLAV